MGVPEMDVHHRFLLRWTRHLARALDRGAGSGTLRASIRHLRSHLASHHAIEARWMAEEGYPGVREHERLHAEMMDRVAAALAGQGAEAEGRLREGAASIARMLEEHMRKDDLKIRRFSIARDNLRRLAEMGPGVGASLTPIPGTLAPATPVPGERPAAARVPPRRLADDQPAVPPGPRTTK